MSDLELVREVARVINAASREKVSNTADVWLADFMVACLKAFEVAVVKRSNGTFAVERIPELMAENARLRALLAEIQSAYYGRCADDAPALARAVGKISSEAKP